MLSGEHFSVDGALIHAWASQKSVRRKDGSDGDRPPEDWHGELRTSPRAIQNRSSKGKNNVAPALPSYLGHVLTDNQHGLVVNVRASQSSGFAEREVAAEMPAEAAEAIGKQITAGADKGYDTCSFG